MRYDPPIKILTLFLFAVCSLQFTACEDKGEEPYNPPPIKEGIKEWPATRSSEGGSFEVTLSPEGGTIEGNQHFSFDLIVTPKDGSTEGITIAADADMPAHQHGMNTKPEVSEIDGGGYRVDGMLLHMFGDWEIMIDVTRGGKTERTIFPVSVE